MAQESTAFQRLAEQVLELKYVLVNSTTFMRDGMQEKIREDIVKQHMKKVNADPDPSFDGELRIPAAATLVASYAKVHGIS
jgi:hypothetical protein